MNVVILPPAEAELEEAVQFYNERQIGLGEEFLSEFQAAITRIIERPLWFEQFEPSFRRCRMRRFPYGLIFELADETIVITAVMHLHREPNRWKDRIDQQDRS